LITALAHIIPKKLKIRLLFTFIVLSFITIRATAQSITTAGSYTNLPSTSYGTAGAASSTGTYTVSGTGLTSASSILVTTSNSYIQICLTSTGTFGSSVSVPVLSGNAATTTIYVRISATAPFTTYSTSNLTCSATGASSQTIICPYVVSAAPLTITSNNVTKIYGTTLTTPVSGSTAFTYTGIKNSETIGSVTMTYLNYYGTGALATAPVGTYTNQATPSAATGGTFNASNYSITYVSSNVIVVAAALTITSAAASNKPYDGTTAATITGTLSGVVNGDVVTLNGTGTFASANVGTGIAVTSTSTLGGSGASNYTLTQPTGLTANITQATLTITANNVTKTYGTAITGGSGSTAFTSTGLASGQTIGSVTIAYSSQAATTGAAGIYSAGVIPSAATGGTFIAANYTIVYADGSLIVNQKTLTLTSPAASNKVYDGTTTATITGTLSGIVNSDVVTLVGTGTFASANVGTGIAVTSTSTLSGSGAGNYTLTEPTGLTANITKAALTITATGPQYTGGTYTTPTTGSTTNFTYSGTVNGETITSVTLTPTPDYTTLTTGTSYTVAPSAPAGSTAFSTGNYTITYVNFSGVAGTNYTWTGNTGTLWNTPTNWSPNGVPGTSDNVTIPATTNKPTVNVAEACGSVSITGTTTLTLSYPLTVSGALSIGGNTFTFTVAGTNAVSFGGLTDIGFQSSMVINSGATVTFNSNSTVTNLSSQRAITNNGSLNLLANCTFNSSGSYTSFVNNGTVTATSTTFNLSGSGSPYTNLTNSNIFKATSCTFNMIGSDAYIFNTGSSASFTTKNCSFTSTGSGSNYFSNTSGATYLDHGSTITMTGQANYINNAGTMTLHGTTITFATGGSVQQYLGNSGVLQIDSGAIVYLNQYKSYIANTGTFYAGATNSPCIIYLNGQSSNVSNNSGAFNLASTSVIYPSGVTCYVNNNSGTFTLLSDIYGTASIMSFYTTPGGLATSSGNFNVQRYVTGGTGYRGYRLLSSPVNYSFSYSGTTNIYAGDYSLKYVNTDIGTNYAAITGGSGSGFTVTIANPTMYLYNESLPTNNSTFTGGKDAGITSISSTTVSTLSSGTATSGVSIPVGNGYFLFYIGNDATGYTLTSSSPTAATITATGPLNLQSIPVVLWWNSSKNLSYTSSYGSNAGYNLVGNPYPCAIDLHQVYTDNGSVYPNFAELNDYGQTFVYYNASTGGTSTPSTYRYVASGQGFFVQATATGQTLTFNEDQKYYATNLLNDNGSSPAVLLSLHPKTTPFTTTTDAIIEPTTVLSGLHLMLKQDSTNYTFCGIYFNKNWSDAYDNKTDAFDLGGLGAKVLLSSYTSDNVRTGINSLGDYSKGKKIKLYVMATTDGIYHLTLNDIANIDTTNFNVYLIDNANNDSLDMVHYKTYNFNLTAADTAAFHNRFVLVIERKAMPLYSLVTFAGQKANTAIQLNWKTSGEGNYTGFGLEKLGANGQYTLIDSAQSNGTGLYSYNDQNTVTGSNIYRLAQNDINGKVTFAGPININYNAISASGTFTIYPNPSKDIINVAVNSSTTGNAVIQTYLANIYSLGGTLMDARQLNTNNFTQDITSYKPGVYILELKTTAGDIIGKAKFVKTN